MEIALIGPSALRLKGKSAVLIVDPMIKTKTTGDAVLLLSTKQLEAEVEGSRLTIVGAGEYEVGGVKITGVQHETGMSYYVSLDGISVLLSLASNLKGKENLRDVDIAVLHANVMVDQSVLATVADSVALFYGEQASENVKALGKEVVGVSKYIGTKDKLPTEMEVVLLA